MEIIKLWGSELILENNDKYCLKKLRLYHGRHCSSHMHLVKQETFIINDGIVLLQVNEIGKDPILETTYIMPINTKITIMPETYHRFTAITPTAEILEMSTHDSPEDSYRAEGKLSGKFEGLWSWI